MRLYGTNLAKRTNSSGRNRRNGSCLDSKNKPGAQNKTVTVTANTEPAQTFLKIKAQVNKVEAE